MTVAPTTGPEPRAKWPAIYIARGADLMLAAGGDGTINEVAEGMVHSQVPLGILPAGTANVLAMEMKLGSKLERAAVETLLKRLGCWDNEGYQSTDITLCESMFLDSVITRVLDTHIKELGLKFGLSETKSSDFKDLETGSQLFLPIALQVQWLTTRLRFWDSQPTIKMVDAFGDTYSQWLDWRRLERQRLSGCCF